MPSVGAALRFNDMIRPGKSYLNQILPALKAQNVGLTPCMIGALSEVAKFLGLNHKSPIGHLAGV